MLKRLDRGEMKEIFDTRMVQDFPPDELKPWKRIAEMLDEGVYFAYGQLGAVFEPLVGACPSDHHRLVNGRSGKGPITRDTVGAKLEVQLSDAKVDVPA